MKFAKSAFAPVLLAAFALFGVLASCGEKDDDAEPTPTATPKIEKKPVTMNLKADCAGKPCF